MYLVFHVGYMFLFYIIVGFFIIIQTLQYGGLVFFFILAGNSIQ